MQANGQEPPTPAWHRWLQRDRSWCQALHRGAAYPSIVYLFMLTSRLSDGMVWYLTIIVLPWVSGPMGFACSLRMLCLGAVNLALYSVFKRYFARPRPYVGCPGIRACTRSLDEYSFPSGHVVHAVGFGTVLCTYYPGLAWVVWPFAVLVALSRVVLGLHYPSDVGVGAVMGWLMARAVLVLF